MMTEQSRSECHVCMTGGSCSSWTALEDHCCVSHCRGVPCCTALCCRKQVQGVVIQ